MHCRLLLCSQLRRWLGGLRRACKAGGRRVRAGAVHPLARSVALILVVAVRRVAEASKRALWDPAKVLDAEMLREAEQVTQGVVLRDATRHKWVEASCGEEGLMLALLAVLVVIRAVGKRIV